MEGLTPTAARAQRERDHKEERAAAHACALDFLVFGDEGDHGERCIFADGGDACSRDYAPFPPSQRVEWMRRTGIVEPIDENTYVGTGVGLLYGMPGPSALAATLAGWNVVQPPEEFEGGVDVGD